MAEFEAKPFDKKTINGGNRFENEDGINAEVINAPIESALFVQSLAENEPDISEANQTGTAAVSIVKSDDGTPRFKFSNLKGNTGETPVATVLHYYRIRINESDEYWFEFYSPDPNVDSPSLLYFFEDYYMAVPCVIFGLSIYIQGTKSSILGVSLEQGEFYYLYASGGSSPEITFDSISAYENIRFEGWLLWE